ncbi:hypothetical protein TRAPUB_2142 [Trametes pubescens]|uniref:BTB domain-containing protein n=1 Tax=Trametes pubescens TaxID=154538 RepID=A0A1M2VHE8_TRAPU|nr:hypothetical protein TRAPUB_2142 [Trametes pubescens]
MEDGSIVLISKGRGFKVYKGILAAQSPVFRDMFASSSPETEAIDNCPVVHVSDSAEDLRHFLGAITPITQPMYVPTNCGFEEGTLAYYRSTTVRLHRAEGDPKIPAATIFAIARLAHKYQADELQRQALSCIQEYYAICYDVWENKGQQGNVPFETSDMPRYAIEAVAIARLTNTPSILPLAFYDCCRLGGKVLEGWRHEDGSISRLADEDLERCLDGTRELACHAAKATTLSFSPEPVCQSYCNSQTRIRLLLLELLSLSRWLHAPLHACTDLFAELAHARSVCAHCQKTLEGRVKEQRRMIWPRLPSIFHLEADISNWGSG